MAGRFLEPGAIGAMSPALVRLELQARTTTLGLAPGECLALPVGTGDLLDRVMRHDPPTPAELERAIDLVEDALNGSRLVHADRGDLLTEDPLLAALPGLGGPGARLTREAVESLFQRLASRSLGTPVPESELPTGRGVAAALLIVRECMHHLGFAGLQVPADGLGQDSKPVQAGA